MIQILKDFKKKLKLLFDIFSNKKKSFIIEKKYTFNNKKLADHL